MKTIFTILIFLFSFTLQAATFSADRIEEACRSFLLQKYSQDCKVDFSTKFEDITISNSDVKAVFDGEFTQKNKGVKLDFTSNGKVLLSQVYNFDIKKEITLYSAKSYIPPHTTISSSMLVETKDYIKLEDIGKYINPVGRIVKNSIYKGDLLSSENTLPELSVKRGENIVIIASNGTVTVRGMGTAMEDGRVGETIRVKRDNSKKLLTGKINEAGELILGEQ